MVYTCTRKRTVEIGRVVLKTAGWDSGKIGVIVNIVDPNTLIIDGPSSGLRRQVTPVKDIELTSHTVDIPYGANQKIVKQKFDESGVAKDWAESSWAKSLASKQKRAAATDLERFKIKRAKRARAFLVRSKYFSLKKGGKGKGARAPAGKGKGKK